MIARQLRYRIKILKRETVMSEYGTSQDSYSDYYTTKAGITYNSGGETFSNHQTEPQQKLTFTIRKRKDKEITERDRIEYDGNQYNITEIIPKFDGLFKSIEIKATRIEN